LLRRRRPLAGTAAGLVGARRGTTLGSRRTLTCGSRLGVGRLVGLGGRLATCAGARLAGVGHVALGLGEHAATAAVGVGQLARPDTRSLRLATERLLAVVETA